MNHQQTLHCTKLHKLCLYNYGTAQKTPWQIKGRKLTTTKAYYSVAAQEKKKKQQTFKQKQNVAHGLLNFSSLAIQTGNQLSEIQHFEPSTTVFSEGEEERVPMLVSLYFRRNDAGSKGRRSQRRGFQRQLTRSRALDLLPEMQLQPLKISLHVWSYLADLALGS